MNEMIFPAKLDALEDAIAFTEGELEKMACPMRAVMQITVCVEEMFVNVAHYAYDGAEGTVAFSIGEEQGMVVISLKDSGKPFDPLAKTDPDITLSAEEREVGGLGIFMVKKSMDEVDYERTDGLNIFTMKKKIR